MRNVEAEGGFRNFSEFTPVARGREQMLTRVCVPAKAVFTPRGVPERRGFDVAGESPWVRFLEGGLGGSVQRTVTGGVSGQKSWAEVAQGAGADRKPRNSSRSRAAWRVSGSSGWNCR